MAAEQRGLLLLIDFKYVRRGCKNMIIYVQVALYFVLGEPSTSGVRMLTRRQLFDEMQCHDFPNLDQKLKYLENHLLSGDDYTEDQIKSLRHRNIS